MSKQPKILTLTLEDSLFLERQYVAKNPVYFRRFPHQECKACGGRVTWTADGFWATYGTTDVNCKEALVHRMLTIEEEQALHQIRLAEKRSQYITAGMWALAGAMWYRRIAHPHTQPSSGGGADLFKAQYPGS